METVAGNGGLGAIAAEKGLMFGASFSVAELDHRDGVAYAEVYRRDAKVLTSELEFKFGTLRPMPTGFNFAPADRLLDFARANALAVRGHTLIWNDYLPEWVKTLTAPQIDRLMEEHLTTVMTRYRGQVFEWDVVNEPIGPWDGLPGNLRAGPFFTAMGEQYIDRSLRLAKSLDPKARLFVNEAQTETNDENGRIFRDSFLGLIRRVLDRGAPLTGVGLQCHLSSKSRYDLPGFVKYLEELSALGLEISITELDCNDAAFPDRIEERDEKVAGMYRRFLSAVLPLKSVKLLTTWQLADEKSWLWYQDVQERPRSQRRPRPLLYDSAFKPKLSYHAVAESLLAMPHR